MSITRMLIQLFTSIFIAISVIGLFFWLHSANELKRLKLEDKYQTAYLDKVKEQKAKLVTRVKLSGDNEVSDDELKRIATLALQFKISPLYFIGAHTAPVIVQVQPGPDFEEKSRRFKDKDGKLFCVIEDNNKMFALIPPTDSEEAFLERFGLTVVSDGERHELREWMLPSILETELTVGSRKSISQQIERKEEELPVKTKDRDETITKLLGSWSKWGPSINPIDEAISELEQRLIRDWEKNNLESRGLQRDYWRVRKEHSKLINDHINENEANYKKVAKVVEENDRIRRKIFDLIESELSSSTRMQPDGKVIAVSPNQNLAYCWIDIGREEGVRRGMKFTTFRNENNFQKKTGEIEVAEVYATSSACKIIASQGKIKRDPLSNWETTRKGALYSPYAATGNADKVQTVVFLESGDTQTERQRVIDELRPKRQIMDEGTIQKGGASAPDYAGTGVTLIDVGDSIANALFIPILPEREYRKKRQKEIKKLKNIPLGRLTFYIAPLLSVTEKNYVRQMINYNDCTLTTEVTPDTNYLIGPSLIGSLPTSHERLALLIHQLENEIKAKKAKIDDLDDDTNEEVKDLHRRMQTLDMAKVAQKLNIEILTIDEAQNFFRKRRKKEKFLRGDVAQPGRQRFYIAGETIMRSRSDLERYITDNGGLISYKLDTSCDYIIAGINSEKAVETAKKLGIRVLREQELPAFFGLGDSR